MHDGRSNSLDARVEIALDLVLPQADDTPTRAAELREVTLVTGAGFADLTLPRRRQLVPPEGESVPMPEVAVNEHGDPCRWENDVGLSRNAARMLPKAMALPVQRRAHHPLKSGVSSLHTRHAIAALSGREVIRHAPSRDP